MPRARMPHFWEHNPLFLAVCQFARTLAPPRKYAIFRNPGVGAMFACYEGMNTNRQTRRARALRANLLQPGENIAQCECGISTVKSGGAGQEGRRSHHDDQPHRAGCPPTVDGPLAAHRAGTQRDDRGLAEVNHEGRSMTMTADERASLLRASPAATRHLWERIQRAKCRLDAPHYRRLLDVAPSTRVVVDLGACSHCPDAEGGR